jgi:taurine dioxygenase
MGRALPRALQQRILPLKAEHSYLAKYEELRAKNPWRPKLSQAQVDQVAPAVQPVVRTHPETGRKALFVSEHFTTRIVGLPQDEGDALLAELFAHSVKPEFVYRHAMGAARPGVLGQPLADAPGGRHARPPAPPLFRTTIEGDTPF